MKKKAMKATEKEKKMLVEALEIIDRIGEQRAVYIINAFNEANKAEHNQNQRAFTIALRVLEEAIKAVKLLVA